jgi:peptide-methionine (S)-S-oxide reductase
MERAIVGGGCFWCTEAVFLGVKGVLNVESAYAGGHLPNPTYANICDGDTGHAEVVSVEFDETVISYEQILNIFFGTHDPTTLNRQGHDTGTQYRSVIFALNDGQAEAAKAMIAKFNEEDVFDAKVVTEVTSLPLSNYYPAEAYHQRYYQNHPHQGYCLAVVAPKMSKFRKNFTQFMK